MELNKTVAEVTRRLVLRSNDTRKAYLKAVDEQIEHVSRRPWSIPECANWVPNKQLHRGKSWQ